MNNTKKIILQICCLVLCIGVCFSLIIPKTEVKAFVASDVDSLSEEQWEDINKMASYLTNEMGLSEAAALGVLGNIGAECGFKPNAHEQGNSGLGVGIVQWTSEPRRSNFLAMCPDWEEDLPSQLEYIKYEFEHDYSKVGNYLADLGNDQADMYNAAWYVLVYYETPTGQQLSEYGGIHEIDAYANGLTDGRFSSENRHYYKTAEVRGNIAKALLDSGKLDFSLTNSKLKEFSLVETGMGNPISVSSTSGASFLSSKSEKSYREQVNTDILESTVEGISTTENEYSLYDRFGPNIQFVQYLGEESTDITLIDHIVYKLFQDDEGFSLDDVKYVSNRYLSTKVYKNRPVALTQDLLKSGYTDPRVNLYASKGSNLVTLTKYFWSTRRLAISQFVVNLTSLLISNKFMFYMFDFFDSIIKSSFWTKTIPEIIKIFIPLACIGLIISVISYTRKYVTGASGGVLKAMFQRVLVGVICTGLVFGMLYNASFVNTLGRKIVTYTNSLFSLALNETYEGDEVITSDVKSQSFFEGMDDIEDPIDSTTEAAIWKVAIFEPWCIGTFGDKYENLYTQFSDKPEENKLPQSHDDISSIIENNTSTETSSGKILWVGDSRFVGMAVAKGVSYSSSLSMVSSGDDIYLAKEGVGTSFLSDNLSRILSSSADTIIVNLGVNSLGNASSYATTINNLAQSKKVYVMSVNAVDESKVSTVTNAQINKFNRELKSKLDGNVTYIDTNGSISVSTTDGLHYTSSTSKEIYNRAKSSITRSMTTITSDSDAHYDSASLTGDVVVDIGGGKQVRNWAAYLWSAQSIYHIDHSIYEDKSSYETTNEDGQEIPTVWPLASTTAYSPQVNADIFRVIDAKMNISPQYFSDKNVIYSYADSNNFVTDYPGASKVMLFRTILLLGLWPVIFIRLYRLIGLITSSLQFIFYGIAEIAKEGYGLSTCWKKVKTHFIGYIYATIQLFLLITIYLVLIGKGPIFTVLYVVMVYVISKITPKDIVSKMSTLKHQIGRFVNNPLRRV